MIETVDKRANGAWLSRPQRRLGQSGLIVFIILANTIIPFSIDMYTPAVPSLPGYFGTTEQMVNFTLMGFFLCLTVASLVFGPVSDRFGRKPLLVGSLVAYTAGGALCAMAPNIYFLIAARVVQAFGAGALMAVSMALVKDCFVEERREQMISIIQVLSVVGPVIAPLIGGILLQFFDWRASFVALACFGAVCLVFALLFQESLPAEERNAGGFGATMSGLVKVGRNRSFMVLLVVVALFNVAFNAYLAVGSYIYVDYFGTTPQEYTYFFAVTAAFTALGPFIWLKARAKVTPRVFTHVMIGLGFVAAVCLLVAGESSVFAFCGALILFATIQSAIRPYTTNILLSQQEGDTGAASSLIGFTISIFGVVGMNVIMLGWPTYIVGIGAIMLVCVVLSCVLWVWLLHSPRIRISEFEK
ncbi:MAG: multidrug effflux MFS transporter [Eggerthellaceae bacterium]|nr:multidrug effflux MFS transporter [Eggerthellaceae bacterium]